MKTVLIIVIILYGCGESKHEAEQIASKKAELQTRVDSVVKSSLHNIAIGDTSNLSTAPVIIVSASLTKRDYSNYKDVSLTYKNISNKKIEAIKFKWYGTDAFGDPADMGSAFEGIGGGFYDEGLRPGKSKTSTWGVMSSKGKKIVRAWPYEVVFTDGTKWKVDD